MRDGAAPPRLLLAAACNWESTVPLATSLRDAGFAVSVCAPRSHRLHRVSGLSEHRRYRHLMPMTSLRRAIEAVRPAIVMPCDEPTIALLQRLRRKPRTAADIRDAIERALGPPEAASLLTSRTGLNPIAEATGVRIPQSAEIKSARALRTWLTRYGAPAYLKIDRSTGGRGVVRVNSVVGALLAYYRLRLLFGLPRALWLWLRWNDISGLPLLFGEGPAAITVQQAIDGVPANCALAAWRGNLLACVAVEALETCIPDGVATVIRVREDRLMEEAAEKVAAQLSLSGLFGVDFVIAGDTGRPWLIEINGRPTQTAYLRLGPHADLAGALFGAVTGRPSAPVGIFKPQEIITLFDQPSGNRPRIDVHAPITIEPVPANLLDLPSGAANSALLPSS
jgi:hypothetical protein